MKRNQLRLVPIGDAEKLSHLVDQRTSGGCLDCNAYYDTFEQHCPDAALCVHVYHASTCPYYGQMEDGQTRQEANGPTNP